MDSIVVHLVTFWIFLCISDSCVAAPEVTLSPVTTAYVNSGSSLTLTCGVNENVGAYFVYFQKNGINRIFIYNVLNCNSTNLLNNETSAFSVSCNGLKSFTMLQQTVSIGDHDAKWNCFLTPSGDNGPCTNPPNQCTSLNVNIFVRVPVTRVQLTDDTGNSLSSPVAVAVGNSTIFRCNTSPNGSRPRAIFHWYKRHGTQLDDQFISSTPVPGKVPGQTQEDLVISYSTLTLMGNRSFQNMYIFCAAKNEANSGPEIQSAEIQLSIMYPPIVSLTPNNSVYNVTEGKENFVLMCDVLDANPQPQANAFIWRHQGTVLRGQTSASYIFQPIQKSDDGQYQCSASNPYGMGNSSNMDLNVQYGPAISYLGSIDVDEGVILNVICNVSANPPPTISWTRQGEVISNSAVLIVPSITRMKNGDYNCTASNFLYPTGQSYMPRIASDALRVNVLYGPGNSTRIQPEFLVYEFEERMMSWDVRCSATCNPGCFYKWVRNDIQLSSQDTLSLGVIYRNMTGRYACEAYNTVNKGRLSSTIFIDVIVKYAPDINIAIDGLTQENMSPSLRCEVKGVPSTYAFHPWKHMLQNFVIRSDILGIPTGSTNSSRNILILERISLQDMGTYICSADNGIKGINGDIIQTGTVDLKVAGIPYLMKEDKNLFAAELGHSINISIPFFSYPLIQTFVFQRNGAAVTNTSRTSMVLSAETVDFRFYDKPVQLEVQVAHLYIQNLTLLDLGNYTLVLENLMGKRTFIVQLNASGPPLIVNRFYFSQFIEDQIELNFEPGFNGGSAQTFVIEYKSATAPDMIWKNSSVPDLKETNMRLHNGTYIIRITQPSPGNYTYRMYSWNNIGRSPYSAEIAVMIPQVDKQQGQAGSSVAVIAGGIGAAMVIIALVSGVLIFIKRRRKSSDEELKRELQKHERPETGLVDNLVYDSSGDMLSPSTNTGSIVVKPKHPQKAAKVEHSNDLYAMVDKNKTKTDKTAASKGRQGKTSKGDVYENTPLPSKGSAENVYENPVHLAADLNSSENVYENPEASTSKGQLVNKDALLYADLKFGPSTTKAGKPVIHGLDNRTEYAEIAYGKRGESLPLSDEEKENGGAKKKNGTQLNTDD